MNQQIDSLDDIPDIMGEIAAELELDDDLNMIDFGSAPLNKFGSVPLNKTGKKGTKAKQSKSGSKISSKHSSKKKKKNRKKATSDDEFDPPDWETQSKQYDKQKKTGKVKKKPEWGIKKSPPTIRNQLKSNKKYTPKREIRKVQARDKSDFEYDMSRDVVDRLTDSKSYGSTHQRRFDKSGKGKGMDGHDAGNEQIVGDLSQITRAGLRDKRTSKAKRIGKLYDDDDGSGDMDENVYEGDLLCDKEDLDAQEMDSDEEKALIRKLEMEMSNDSMGIPDWKKGKYSTAQGRKLARQQAKKKKKKGTKSEGPTESKRAQYMKGKNVLSYREQEELDREKAAAAAKIKICKMKSCEELLHKSGYCAHHFNLYCKKAPKKKEIVQHKEECHGCKKPVIGKMIQAMDVWWHPDCFVCPHCNQPFPGGKFVRLNKKAYCKPCAIEVSGAGSSGGRSGGRSGGSRPGLKSGGRKTKGRF